MDEHADLIARLRRLGTRSPDPGVERRHLHQMTHGPLPPSTQRPAGPPGLRRKLTVAAAFGAGLLAGSTGLAAAGALPAPAQDTAADVLEAVGLNVPRSTEGCPEGQTFGNHGEYVSSVEAAGGDVAAAARSECGKPVHVKGGPGGGPAAAPHSGDPCKGPPPWAGRAGQDLTPAEREALRAERAATCGSDDPDVEDEGDPGDEESTEPANGSDAGGESEAEETPPTTTTAPATAPPQPQATTTASTAPPERLEGNG